MNYKEKILNRKHKSVNLFFKYELSKNEQQQLINKYDTNNIHEICYREINNLIKIPKCKYCGQNSLFKNFREGYREYCNNPKCQYQNRKEQMINHYGVENVFQLDNIKEKIKNTNIKKYGVENPSQSQEVKKKKEETCLKHWGVKSSLSNKQIRQNIKNTCQIKYNGNCPYSSEIIKNKGKKTCLEKYGVENPSQSQEVKKKKEETCLKHWGVTNYWKDPNNRKNFHSIEAKKKEYETKKKNGTFNSSSTENKSLQLLRERFPDLKYQYKNEIYPFNCDFYIPSLNLYIEYNEHWTHGFKPFENTKEDQKKLELWKSKNTKYYNTAIQTWTQRDIIKRKIAKEKNLNWLEFWNLNELINWINNN